MVNIIIWKNYGKNSYVLWVSSRSAEQDYGGVWWIEKEEDNGKYRLFDMNV